MLGGSWPTTISAAAILGEFLLRIALVCVVLLRSRGTPAVRLAWIAVVLVVPVIGLLAYLLVGEIRLGRRRIARHAAIVKAVSAAHPLSSVIEALNPPLEPDLEQVAALAEHIGGNDALAGNELTLIGATHEFIERLVNDIDEAASHCHLLFYIYLTDASGHAVGEALMRAAKRGVTCRLLVDAVGSDDFLRSDLRQRMQQAGVRVVAALPANPLRMLFARLDLRNHRKLAVIDGAVGYTGSQNIADAAFAPKPRYAPWVDASVRLVGPVTWDLQMLFVEDWYLDTDESLESVLALKPPIVEGGVPAQVMGTGPNANNEALRQISHLAFHNAREELVITTPYFVPDQPTLMALATAARRGVKTTLIVPARNDSPLVAAASRSFYGDLLDAGVEILEYRSGLLHAKTMTIDRRWALVTTANLDRRSFELNFEVSLLVYDSDFASQLRFLQSSYMSDSEPVDRRRWAARPWPVRLWQNAAGTLSPLL